MRARVPSKGQVLETPEPPEKVCHHWMGSFRVGGKSWGNSSTPLFSPVLVHAQYPGLHVLVASIL